jgi:hypothetical protein
LKKEYLPCPLGVGLHISKTWALAQQFENILEIKKNIIHLFKNMDLVNSWAKARHYLVLFSPILGKWVEFN